MGIFTPSTPLIVDAMLIGETIIVAMLVLAVLFAKKHLGYRHHYLIISAFLLDEIIFKPLMISRAIDGSNGYFPWDGTAILPHLFLSVVMTLLGVLNIILGLKNAVKKEGKMFLPPKGNLHRWIGRIFVIIWIASYVVGLYIFIVTWT